MPPPETYKSEVGSQPTTPDSQVWTAGMAGWAPANTVPALQTLFAAPPPLPTEPPPTPPPAAE